MAHPDDKREAIHAVLEGVSIQDIAEELSVSTGTIRNWVKDYMAAGGSVPTASASASASASDLTPPTATTAAPVPVPVPVPIPTTPTTFAADRAAAKADRAAVKATKDAAVIADYTNPELTIFDVVLRNDISILTLYNILRRHNVPLRQQAQIRKKHADDETIVNMYLDGATISVIRIKTNRTYNYIYERLHANGVPLRRG